MALPYEIKTGDGVTRSWTVSFPFEISHLHVKAEIDGVAAELEFTAPATFVLAEGVTTPANGVKVRIYRETPSDPLVAFGGIALNDSESQRIANLQAMYLAQENSAISADALGLDNYGVWNARNKRIVNVANPANAQDAATKDYVDDQVGEDWAGQAEAAKVAAEAAKEAAEAAEADAEAAAASVLNKFETVPTLTAFRALAGRPAVVILTLDGRAGTFRWKADDITPDNGATHIRPTAGPAGAYVRDWWGSASAAWWGVKGNADDDDTDALNDFFDGSKGPSWGHIPEGFQCRITRYIRYSGSNRLIEGSLSSGIFMDVAGTIDGGGVYRIQPCVIVDTTASSSTLRGLTIDHRASNWPVYPTSDFTEEVFAPDNPPDPKGQCIMVMAHKFTVDGTAVLNAWDNGIGYGIYNESTGGNEVGPDQCLANNVFTYNCGLGKHAWPIAPGVSYFNIGAGINFLHATNFVAQGCRDFGSSYGFYADITGGNRGAFTNCHSAFARMPTIWSDAAEGGNQFWNQGGFGQTITGTSAGWLKTSGGVGFYLSSYGTQIIGCSVDSPALYGFALEYQAVANQLTACRVRNAGLSALVVTGKGHKITDFVIEGACLLAGTTPPSGSVLPSILPAILVTGMKESPSNIEVHTTVEFKGLVVKPSQEYYGVAPATVKYTHAIHARTRNGVPAKVVLITAGGEIVAGTTATYTADSGSSISILQVGGEGVEGKYRAQHIGSESAHIEVKQGDNAPLQVLQSSAGNVTIHNYKQDGTTVVTQERSGGNSKGILIWAGSVRLLNLPTSTSGLFAGDLWNDSGTVKIV